MKAVSIALLLLFSAGGSAYAATELAACDVWYQGELYLGGDLDCSAYPPVTITGGSLDLAGFTFTGELYCQDEESCSVRGPGTVVGHIRQSSSGGKLEVTGVSVSGEVISGRLALADSTVGGLIYGTRVRMENSIAATFAGQKCQITDSMINSSDPLYAVYCERRLSIRNTTVTNSSGSGIWSSYGPLKLIESSIVNNAGSGVRSDTRRVTVRDSEIRDNGLSGLVESQGQTCDGPFESARGKVVGSTIENNGIAPDCGVTQACADVQWCVVPVFIRSTCNTSHVPTSGIPGTDLGICSAD